MEIVQKAKIIREIKEKLKDYEFFEAPCKDFYLEVMANAFINNILYDEPFKFTINLSCDSIIKLFMSFLKKINIEYYQKINKVIEEGKILIYEKKNIIKFDDIKKPLKEINFLNQYYVKSNPTKDESAPEYKAFFPFENNLDDVFASVHEIGHILCYDDKKARSWATYSYLREIPAIFMEMLLVEYLSKNKLFPEKEIAQCELRSLNNALNVSTHINIMLLLKDFSKLPPIMLNSNIIDFYIKNNFYPDVIAKHLWELLDKFPVSEEDMFRLITYLIGHFYAICLKKVYDLNPSDTMLRFNEFVKEIGNISINDSFTLLGLDNVNTGDLEPYISKVKKKLVLNI